LRIFDHDTAELSNVNRQMLFRRSNEGAKVNIVDEVTPSPHTCLAIPERFSLSLSPRHLPLAPYVLVGVDDIPSRWNVQRSVHGWLGVGATSHFSVSTSSHELNQPCAGCLHPEDDPQPNNPIPTVSFVSFWAGLALAVRFLRHIGGRPYEDKEQHLWLSTLRMDENNGKLWRPIAARSKCPVSCVSSIIHRSAGKSVAWAS
jgi:hypothetical protein